MTQDHSIVAVPHRLLLCERGGHFKIEARRDTEKETGMLATLIVQLQSSFKGGYLLVRHNDKELSFAFGHNKGRSAEKTFSVALFADCEHELLPVTEGRRIALVYSLYWTGAQRLPSAERMTTLMAAGGNLKGLPQAVLRLSSAAKPYFLVQLKNAYHSMNDIRQLKGKDLEIAVALQEAGRSLPATKTTQLCPHLH